MACARCAAAWTLSCDCRLPQLEASKPAQAVAMAAMAMIRVNSSSSRPDRCQMRVCAGLPEAGREASVASGFGALMGVC